MEERNQDVFGGPGVGGRREGRQRVRLKGLRPSKAEGRVVGKGETFLEESEDRKTDAVKENTLGTCNQRGKRKGSPTEKLPDWSLVQMVRLPRDP